MFSKVVRSLLDRVWLAVELHWGKKTQWVSLLLIIAILSSCIPPGDDQTQVIPTSTTKPQLPYCNKAGTKGFCWPLDKDLSNVKTNWLADSCPWSGNDNYEKQTLPNGTVVYKYHIGWDIRAAENDPVIPIADGSVVWVSASTKNHDAGWGDGNVGIFVKHRIDDGTKNGKEFLALYAHVRYDNNEHKIPENVLLKDDKWKVAAGVSFAKIGPYPGGVHLHFGIVPNGTIPGTDASHGWGKIWCPDKGPITNYNGFTNPYEWITTKSPLVDSILGATAVSAENPTPTAPIPIPGATPILTVSPNQMFSVGDYFVYEIGGSLDKKEFIGTELIEGYNTWFFVTTRDISRINSELKSFSYKEWVDQDTGIIVKAELRGIYSVPQGWSIAGQYVDVIDSTEYRVYDLKNNSMKGGNINIDTEGKQYDTPFPQSTANRLGYIIFMVTRFLQIDGWYPWKTDNFSYQVIAEETVSVPAGTFDCWVLEEPSGSRQYLRRYFDKSTGILVKEEYWSRNNGVSEMNGELQVLASYNWSALKPKQALASSALPRLNRAEYFSVLQWIKYASLYNDVSVFENLIVGNSIPSIDSNGNSTTINKADFLVELSKQLVNKPTSENFMFEESGHLVVRTSGWSPGSGASGDTVVYLILELRNNQWVLTSIVYGDHLPSWAQGLERISFDTISLSAGITTGAVCQEARPTRLKIGDFAFVSFYPPLRQRIRSSYGLDNPIFESIALGSAMKILDGPQCANNMVWWKVRVLSSKLEGWTAEGDRDAYWLIPCESRDGCGTQ